MKRRPWDKWTGIPKILRLAKFKTREAEDFGYRHNKYAPYWAVALVILGATGLATNWIDLGPFWKGYVLDMAGPAWNYILFRGLFTAKADNAWTRFFIPIRTLAIFLLVCAGIETAQYFQLYDATYDPWDFLAYISILVPIFVIDLFQNRSSRVKGS